MTHRLVRIVVGGGAGLLLGGQLAMATERIDLYDANSRRTGYIIIDPKTNRLDTYDTRSHRTAWGTIARQSGDIDAFDKNGNRIGTGKLPDASVKR